MAFCSRQARNANHRCLGRSADHLSPDPTRQADLITMTTTITSPIVSLTLWLLLLFSVVTWSIVVRKGWLQWQLARLNQQFHQNFWKAPDLVQAEALATPVSGPLARLARAGFDALQDIRNPDARTLLHSG